MAHTERTIGDLTFDELCASVPSDALPLADGWKSVREWAESVRQGQSPHHPENVRKRLYRMMGLGLVERGDGTRKGAKVVVYRAKR